MASLISLVEKHLGRNFIIFHPSDFSPASEIAFVHALKIALQSKAEARSHACGADFKS